MKNQSRTFHTKHFKIGFIQALGFFFYKDLVSRILVLLIDSYRCSKEKDTLRNFSFRAFHEIQYQGHFMKYFYFSIQHSSREGYTVKFFFHGISWNTVSGSFHEILLLQYSTFIKGRIHCEIFLSWHFMKYSFRVISWNMKYFHEILLLQYPTITRNVSHQ